MIKEWYTLWSLDSWSNGQGGWEVNDRREVRRIQIIYRKVNNWDKAVRRAMRPFIKAGARVVIDDSAWPDIYVTTKDGEWLYQLESLDGRP